MNFLQLTPENIAQARKLSYPEAFNLDKTLGYQKNFPGGVGRVKYGLEGLKSIFGFGDQKIGGATPLTRKVALDAMDLGKKGINLAGKFLSKASLPLSILTPTRLGSSEITEEDRQNMMMNNNMSLGIMNPELLNQFDNITNTGVAGINIDELDDNRSRLLDRKEGILNNVNLNTILSLAEILGPTNLRKALAGTKLGSAVSDIFQGRRDGLGPRSGFLDRTPGYTGQLIASDQYDPITRTNRFDRAKTLFGQSRSLKEYFEKKKALANAKRLGRIPTAPSGDDSGDGGGVKDSGGPTGGYTYDSGGREGFGYGL